MKNIIIKLTKVGNRISEFLIKDNFGNTLIPSITKSELSDGISLSIEDNVTFIDVLSLSKSCCKKEKRVFISQITNTQLAAIETEKTNTASVWEHLTTPLLYNDYSCQVSSLYFKTIPSSSMISTLHSKKKNRTSYRFRLPIVGER